MSLVEQEHFFRLLFDLGETSDNRCCPFHVRGSTGEPSRRCQLPTRNGAANFAAIVSRLVKIQKDHADDTRQLHTSLAGCISSRLSTLVCNRHRSCDNKRIVRSWTKTVLDSAHTPTHNVDQVSGGDAASSSSSSESSDLGLGSSCSESSEHSAVTSPHRDHSPFIRRSGTPSSNDSFCDMFTTDAACTIHLSHGGACFDLPVTTSLLDTETEIDMNWSDYIQELGETNDVLGPTYSHISLPAPVAPSMCPPVTSTTETNTPEDWEGWLQELTSSPPHMHHNITAEPVRGCFSSAIEAHDQITDPVFDNLVAIQEWNASFNDAGDRSRSPSSIEPGIEGAQGRSSSSARPVVMSRCLICYDDLAAGDAETETDNNDEKEGNHNDEGEAMLAAAAVVQQECAGNDSIAFIDPISLTCPRCGRSAHEACYTRAQATLGVIVCPSLFW